MRLYGKLECRIVITRAGRSAEVGMYDPETMRYVPLGTHTGSVIDTVVHDLKKKMEQAGNWISFCER